MSDGSWIRAGRNALDLSQADLAARVGSNQGCVSSWERGKKVPTAAEVAKLEALFGGKAPQAPAQPSLPLPVPPEAASASAPVAPPQNAASPSPAAAKRPGKAMPNPSNPERTGSLGFEDKLWTAADLLRNNMDPAEYKHVVLGLLFLKYIEERIGSFKALFYHRHYSRGVQRPATSSVIQRRPAAASDGSQRAMSRSELDSRGGQLAVQRAGSSTAWRYWVWESTSDESWLAVRSARRSPWRSVAWLADDVG